MIRIKKADSDLRHKLTIKTIMHLLVIVAIGTVNSVTIGQDQWSSFQNGGLLQSKDWELPEQWSPTEGVAWKVALEGYGQSSPVLANDTVYITSVTGDNKESLNIQAIATSDGSIKWMYQLPNSSPEKNTRMVSRAAPTPVTDPNGVIAFFEGGNLVALDHAGKLRWKRDLKSEFGDLKARHGLAASLEQDESSVFVWCERMETPYVLAISKTDGQTIWKQPGLGATSWSSPRLIQVGGERHLVLSAIGIIAGLDPRTGKRLWDFKEVSGNSSSTPVAIGDGKFLIGSSGGREGTKSVPSCGVISVVKNDNAYSVAWEWAAEKTSCSFGSPLAVDGKAYFVNRTGIIYCHDLKSGEKIFVDRLPAGQIWATPLAARNGIYFFGKDGMTSIIERGDRLSIIAKNKLWTVEQKAAEGAGATSPGSQFSGSVLYAAVANQSRLILRRGDTLYCVK